MSSEHKHYSFLAHHFSSMVQQTSARKLEMWLFISQEILFFWPFCCLLLHPNGISRGRDNCTQNHEHSPGYSQRCGPFFEFSHHESMRTPSMMQKVHTIHCLSSAHHSVWTGLWQPKHQNKHITWRQVFYQGSFLVLMP